MKQYFGWIVILFTIVSTTFSSCDNGESDVDDIESTTGNGISLKVLISESSQTRALTEAGEDALNENMIASVDVFIFEENQDSCFFYQHAASPNVISGTNEYDIKLDITQDAFTYNQNYYIYVVANYSGSIPSEGLSLTELKKLNVSGLNPDAVQSSFLMDGVSLPTILNDLVVQNKNISVPLERAAAKIRIGMVYGNKYSLSSVTPISKKLLRYAVNSSVLGNGNELTPDLESMTNFTDISSGVNEDNKIILYSYSNDWNGNLSEETYVVVNVPVIDSLNVEHPKNYYRISLNYFLGQDSDAKEPTASDSLLYRIQRNYLYDITLLINGPGSEDPHTPVTLKANYTIQDWTTKDVIVAVEGLSYLYVENTNITLPNSTSYTTTFQSSSPDVQINNIKVNGVSTANGSSGVNITCDQDVYSGKIYINSDLPTNFVAKNITFDVTNKSGLTQSVTVAQFPSVYLSSDVSAETPSGGQGQDNKAMYIVTSLVADFSALKDPDEFDEVFPSGYTHYAADPALGASYAEYIRTSAVLGYPLTDSDGATVDTDENNRRISPRFMMASQYGATTSGTYTVSKNKCISYSEEDETTNETYTDWRMPTLAELYMIDILQNTKASEVKKILEGSYYWSARQSSTVKFMDPRVGYTTDFNYLNSSVRCVRDVKN